MNNESGEQIAVVANEIVKSRHRLDPRQQKLIAWAASKISRDDTEFIDLKLSVSEFARLIGSESGSLFKEMEAVTRSLLRAIVEVKINDGDRRRVAFQWLSRCVYRDGEGTVEIRFHPELKPYLLELKSRFTQLRLDRFFRFRSSYTIRFFERVEMQRGLSRPTWQMTLQEMRDWLGIEESSYPKFGLLRERVLDAAQRELDAKAEWSFSFKTVKTGKKITGVEFTLRTSKTPKTSPSMERWAKAGATLRAQVYAEARKRREDLRALSDVEIERDSWFLKYVPDLLDVVERGQGVLQLQDLG